MIIFHGDNLPGLATNQAGESTTGAMKPNDDESVEDREDGIGLRLSLPPCVFARLLAISKEVGRSPEECASDLFVDLLMDDEFDRCANGTIH